MLVPREISTCNLNNMLFYKKDIYIMSNFRLERQQNILELGTNSYFYYFYQRKYGGKTQSIYLEHLNQYILEYRRLKYLDYILLQDKLLGNSSPLLSLLHTHSNKFYEGYDHKKQGIHY